MRRCRHSVHAVWVPRLLQQSSLLAHSGRPPRWMNGRDGCHLLELVAFRSSGQRPCFVRLALSVLQQNSRARIFSNPFRLASSTCLQLSDQTSSSSQSFAAMQSQPRASQSSKQQPPSTSTLNKTMLTFDSSSGSALHYSTSCFKSSISCVHFLALCRSLLAFVIVPALFWLIWDSAVSSRYSNACTVALLAPVPYTSLSRV